MDYTYMPPAKLTRMAEAVVAELNKGKVFADDTLIKVKKAYIDPYSDAFLVDVELDSVSVKREASWNTDGDDESPTSVDEDLTYEYSESDDIKKAFKTTEATILGHKVYLLLDECTAEKVDTTDWTIEHSSEEDAGIGSYEFWGEVGYDSRPYMHYEGTITEEFVVWATLEIE